MTVSQVSCDHHTITIVHSMVTTCSQELIAQFPFCQCCCPPQQIFYSKYVPRHVHSNRAGLCPYYLLLSCSVQSMRLHHKFCFFHSSEHQQIYTSLINHLLLFTCFSITYGAYLCSSDHKWCSCSSAQAVISWTFTYVFRARPSMTELLRALLHLPSTPTRTSQTRARCVTSEYLTLLILPSILVPSLTPYELFP